MKCKSDIEDNKINSETNTTRKSPTSTPSGTTNLMTSKNNVRGYKMNSAKDTKSSMMKPDNI